MSSRIPKRFLSGVLTGMWSVVFKTALNLLLIPVLLHAVGADLYGLYILLVGLLEFSIIMDFGFSIALAQCLGLYKTEGRDTEPLLQVGHWIYTVLALLALVGGWLLLPFFPALFHIALPLVGTVKLCLALLVLQAALELYTLYYRAILLSHNLHPWTNVGDILQSIVTSGLGLLFLLKGDGLPTLFLISLGASFLRASILIYQTFKIEQIPWGMTILSAKPKALAPTFKELFHFSAHAMLVNLSVQISHKTDAVVIALFLPLRAIGVYEIVFRFLGITQQIGMKVCEGLFPLFIQLTQRAQVKEARQVFLRMSHFMSFLTGLILLIIVSLYAELFQLFSAGEIPIRETLPILAMVVPLFLSGALQMPANLYLFTSGRQKFLTISSLVAAFFNFGISLLLVRPLGIIGVGLGTLIPQVIQHQASLIREVCRELQISFKEYVVEVYLKVLPPLLGAGLWIFCWHPWIPAEGEALHLVMLGGVAASAFLVGTVLWMYCCMTDTEKNLMAEVGFRLGKPPEVLHG